MLKRWIVSPLCDSQQIKLRQDAVEDLINHPELRQEI